MKNFLLVIVLLMIILLFGCTQQTAIEDPTEPMKEDNSIELPVEESKETSGIDWKESQLKDVITGNTFRISDFKGKPILLESFAVWCPTCTKQQKVIKELHEELGDEVISISLDTDPNEDESQVLQHTQKNGFDWRYAVSTVGTTKALIFEFGNTVVNAPQAPVILICKDQSARLLGRDIKDVEELKWEIEKGC